ncbi:hypothetical protein PKHYL_24580 [Psychrobacter sp. KH172YL61]|nr:hypothetical protein PKHYL_24580 [Psychrobacter sp. KH172YL61]
MKFGEFLRTIFYSVQAKGEGGYLYNIEDDSVWDYQMGQLQQLADGTLPHWDSFYEFMIWYLSDEEDA